MTKFEIITIILAGLSFFISLIAVYLSGQANNTNKNIFRRQGVIDLHMAWQDISEVDKNNLIAPDIVRAVNALSLTASLWNHDVIEKSILYQTYWNSYRDLYDTLININELVPGHKKTCRSLMTNEITKAYEGMKNADLSTVTQTRL
ncbi:hypothetical protein [Flavobacterium degerlachei]|jgi:hypothetical protein|uniref:Uncharacterized protein n=1 Tax=Flavobacterium degerlachei TaxID=229203 RepID=A0A1H3B348_9FLAO|nr:hypothetical protein [Flavobacterium degerlachei]SDX36215.1 hypothetical protein SAMN05444338_109139 [Flavobacterium degerlachei]